MKGIEVRLADICEVITKGTTPSNIGEEFTIDGVRYIRSEMINSSKNISEEGVLYISEETHDKLKRSQLKSGDILFSMAGVYLGKTAILRERDVPANTNQAVALIRVNPKKCNREYIYYFLNLPAIVKSVNSMTAQAAQPNINLRQIGNIPIVLPPQEVQDRVVAVISPYDELIENNQRQIKLLEEAAQRLYKEWFVDLRFPGHENTKITDGIPEGWTRCALGDLIDFNPKVSLSKERKKQSVPMSALSTSSMTLDMAEVYTTESNAGSKFQNGDTLLARITPCLENGKTAFVAGIEAQEGAVGSTEFIVMRSRRLNPYMVYLLARTDDFRNSAINSMTGSDGRQRAQVDKLQALPHLEPPREIIDTFEKNIAPLFLQIRRKNEMNWHLREACDRLLPKLMSGELEVQI